MDNSKYNASVSATLLQDLQCHELFFKCGRKKSTGNVKQGKSATTSVPSISIKFHANAEQLEEIHTDDDESASTTSTDKGDRMQRPPSTANINDPECSPLKYLPKLVKRSTSIDVSVQQQEKQITDSSPPSDPWRFFSDIKGKITKSVEEKITEIKCRNQEEGSPYHKAKTAELKTTKDSKENSSISDSEDLSESSISRTCGMVSTTEGVEMSSDEDTPSREKEKKEERSSASTLKPASSTSLRQRFRFLRSGGGHKTGVAAVVDEAGTGTVRINDLSKLYNINAEKLEQVLPEDTNGEVESAVDALQDEALKIDRDHDQVEIKVSNESILKAVAEKYDNIDVDQENVVTVEEVTGKYIREDFLLSRSDSSTAKTLFAPTGFVDLRVKPAASVTPNANNTYLCYVIAVLSVCLYFLIYKFSPFFSGLALGLMVSFLMFQVYVKLNPVFANIPSKEVPSTRYSDSSNRILEIQAVKEYQPLLKYEGWVNEYPEAYDPKTYHISKTQSVFVRLQGNLLRLSHAKNKVPKRAMWNESEVKGGPIFTHHRIYNLIGAKVRLLPQGLAKKRHWSKKYPICITLAKDQLYFDNLVEKSDKDKEKSDDKENRDKEKLLSISPKERKCFGKFRRKDYSSLAQRFSKLTEDEDIDLDSDSRASTPSADVSDIADFPPFPDEESNNQTKSPNIDSLNEEWSLCSPIKEDTSSELKIYLFGRTDREKEDWFRRLSTATHKEVIRGDDDDLDDHPDNNRSLNFLTDEANTDLEYIKFMSSFKSTSKKSPKHVQERIKSEQENKAAPAVTSEEQQQQSASEADVATGSGGPEGAVDEVLWLNTLIGRVLFDCIRDQTFIQRVKERIQRKLSTIKLPNFIEELLIPELSLGKTSPMIQKAGKPVLDDRGVWIDLDIAYEGDVLLTLQTKLNLMRLKNPQAHEKSVEKVRSAIYHSDVDDSAESSSDEDVSAQEVPNLPAGGETSGVGVGGGGGGSSSGGSPTVTPSAGGGGGGKKFIKMVDRLAESKFFQAATENRYIKKAIEGVSTELRLTVEVKSLCGRVVLNIPPPPSDRIWIGFRPLPEIVLSARPIVGERNISYFMVTSWIEKKLLQEFQKILVVPNMEDFIIPVMNPKLPE